MFESVDGVSLSVEYSPVSSGHFFTLMVNLQACVMTGKTKVNELSLCSSSDPG